MSQLLKDLAPSAPDYLDSRFDGTQQQFNQRLRLSSTVYVGNLSFYTTEEQVYELFSRAGCVKEVVMGLDKYKMTPCGFCFVVYYSHQDAQTCITFLNGVKLDSRPIRVDIDWGGRFETRRFGRGRSGGQVRDEHRDTFDAERGGWGKIVEKNLMDISAHQALKEEAAAGGSQQSHWSKRPRRDSEGGASRKKDEGVLHK